jgi:hypothetical protein
MRPAQVSEALKVLIKARRPGYIWGPPGVGKSSLVHAAARDLNLQVIDLRAVLLDPVDLRGLPVPSGEVVHWRPPSFLPIKGRMKNPGVIFADELAQAAPAVQAAFLQGVLDHRIGETELDPSWTWIAASNRQEDRAGANRVITPLLNRFVHVDLDVSEDDWHAWAASNGVTAEVRAFLRFKPNMLMNFDASRNERAFPTPRSWAFLSQLLSTTPSSLLFDMARGTVGDGAASEFKAFLEVYLQLPDVDKILANPERAAVPQGQPSVLYALAGAISAKCANAPASLLSAVVKYTLRLPQEFSVLTMRDSCLINREIVKVPEAAKWLAANRNIFGLAS